MISKKQNVCTACNSADGLNQHNTYDFCCICGVKKVKTVKSDTFFTLQKKNKELNVVLCYCCNY